MDNEGRTRGKQSQGTAVRGDMEHLFSKIIPERKKKLVIVEDEVLSSSDMSAFLSSKGYDVAATAVNADEAFAAV